MVQYLNVFIASLAPRIPLVLVYFVGLAVAINRYSKHPRISWLAGVYFGASLIFSFFGTFMSFFPIYASQELDMSYSQIGVISSALGIMLAFLNAGLVAVLVYAIFGDRVQADLESE